MPLDGNDSTPRPPDRSTATIEVIKMNDLKKQIKMEKRIMMNPPEDFVQAALAAQPVVPLHTEIVFDQGGQAVMVPPTSLPSAGNSNSNSNSNTDNNDGGGDGETEIPTAGQSDSSPVPIIAPVVNSTPASSPTQTQAQPQTQSQAPNQVATDTAVTPDSTPTQTDAKTIIETITAQVSSATATPTSAVKPTEPTPTDSQAQTSATDTSSTNTDAPTITPSSTQSTPNVRIASSAPSGSASPTVSASPSVSAAAASDAPKPFTQTAPFIFLMVLGSLVIVAVAATLFSTFFRWRNSCGCLPCCRPDIDDDEDGLSDLVRSFDLERTSTAGMSRASSMRRPPPLMDARQVSLQNRSTLFANSPSQAGFLHTTSGVEGSIFESEDEKATTDHLYGGHGGGLEVRNAVEGDIPRAGDADGDGDAEGDGDSHAGIGPRHLGVEGNGLEVPWRPTMPLRAYTGSEASYGEHHPPINLSASYPEIPFPSPPVTINEQPTRASTWASNLRSTLFAAISAQPPQSQEDRYTRQVLPLHRNSTVRSIRSQTDGSEDTFGGRHYPLVIDEKDEQEMDASTSEVGKRFMQRDVSRTSSASRGTMRMSMGDRFQSWSRSGGASVGGGSEWPKAVLAGGGRARGVSSQYV